MVIVCVNIYEISLLSKKKKSNCKYSWTFFFAVYSNLFVSRFINFSHDSAALPRQTGFNLIEKFEIKYTNRARPVEKSQHDGNGMGTEGDAQWKHSEGILLLLSLFVVKCDVHQRYFDPIYA